MADSDKPNNELLDLKQLKSIKVALWTLVTAFVILPVVAGIGTVLVIGFIETVDPSEYHDPPVSNSDDWNPDDEPNQPEGE